MTTLHNHYSCESGASEKIYSEGESDLRSPPPTTADANGFQSDRDGVLLGVDGGATSTVCVCMPFDFSLPENCHSDAITLPILARSVSGCSNHNSVGENAAWDTLKEVMDDALSKCHSNRSSVRAVCLAISGISHSTDQEKVLLWLRGIFPPHVMLYVHNDAVAALSSGTLGKLKGCVLIAGTGCISYGVADDGREAHASGGGPILGDWGGYGIASQALIDVLKAHDGRGPETMLTDKILQALGLASPDELIGWTYEDPSWARIAALVPHVVSCAENGDQVATKILRHAVEELALSVKAVVQKLNLCGEDGSSSFPVVMVGGVLECNKRWDIGKEVIKCIHEKFPGAVPVRPQVEPAVGAALLARNFLVRDGKSHQL